MIDKFPEELRTFETRLLFLKDIFSDCFCSRDILAHCIAHKLDRSLLIYCEELDWRLKFLEQDSDEIYKLKLLTGLK